MPNLPDPPNDPLALEPLTAAAAAEIRNVGFTDDRGRWHPPWTPEVASIRSSGRPPEEIDRLDQERLLPVEGQRTQRTVKPCRL